MLLPTLPLILRANVCYRSTWTENKIVTFFWHALMPFSLPNFLQNRLCLEYLQFSSIRLFARVIITGLFYIYVWVNVYQTLLFWRGYNLSCKTGQIKNQNIKAKLLNLERHFILYEKPVHNYGIILPKRKNISIPYQSRNKE